MQLNRTMGSAVHSTAKNSQTLYGGIRFLQQM